MDIGACICICLYSDEYRIIMTHQCWRLLSILVACGWMPSLIGLSVIMSKIRICIKGEKMPHGQPWLLFHQVVHLKDPLLDFWPIFWFSEIDMLMLELSLYFWAKVENLYLRAPCLGPLCFGNVYASHLYHDFELALKSW